MKRGNYLFSALAVFLAALLYGCSNNPVAGLFPLSGKGAVRVQVSGFPKRNVQSQLTDIDHILISIETSRHTTATGSILATDLYEGAAAITFDKLWPGAATVSATAYGIHDVNIGTASGSASVVANRTSAFNMTLQLSGETVTTGNLDLVGTFLPPINDFTFTSGGGGLLCNSQPDNGGEFKKIFNQTVSKIIIRNASAEPHSFFVELLDADSNHIGYFAPAPGLIPPGDWAGVDLPVSSGDIVVIRVDPPAG